MILLPGVNSTIIIPLFDNNLSIHSAISFSLSECAKTFDANIKSAFFLIFLKFFLSRKVFIVLILFLLAILAKFLAGSIPTIFL